MGKGNQENIVKMLTLIREANPEPQTIILIWDNHPAHLTPLVEQTAKDLQIVLVNLPPYSPDLNPIERIWKQIKKTISEAGLIEHVKHLEYLIQSAFRECSGKLSSPGPGSTASGIRSLKIILFPFPTSCDAVYI